jgi:hypothetical protein
VSRIVLPLISSTAIAADVIHAITTANICIAVEVVVHVDVNITMTPAAAPAPAAAPRSAHGPTNTEGDCACRNHGSG